MRAFFIILLSLLLGGCLWSNRYAHIVRTESQMVQDCQYLDTIAESSDPGRILPKYMPSDAEGGVLHRADRLGATHIVWVYNNPRMGSAAEVYRCDD
jgi:hypothetical protein